MRLETEELITNKVRELIALIDLAKRDEEHGKTPPSSLKETIKLLTETLTKHIKGIEIVPDSA